MILRQVCKCRRVLKCRFRGDILSYVITQLVERLTCLPGVGKKTAQRMAMQLLMHNRPGGLALAKALEQTLTLIKHCNSCRNFTEAEQCTICLDARRNGKQLCVVESPADVLAIEQTGNYRGYYFVLMGHLSPLDGIGPEDLGIALLLTRAGQDVEEVILATNPTVEGEATANYINEKLKPLGVAISRIAHGIPMGSALEYIDGGTLSHALASRQRVE